MWGTPTLAVLAASTVLAGTKVSAIIPGVDIAVQRENTSDRTLDAAGFERERD